MIATGFALAQNTSPYCEGYFAAGAGDSAANGCYRIVHGTGTYELNDNHHLYAFEGIWRIGKHSVNVSYVAKAKSGEPPLSSDSWDCGGDGHNAGGGACPPPSLR